MNIPSLTLLPSAVFPASLPELGGVNPGAAPIEILAQPAVVGSVSIVDLSKPGQLLSASAMLQSQPRSQTAGSVDAVGEQGASVNLDDGFGKLLAAAQLFVDAFNQFQGSDVSNVQDPLIAPFENVLLLAINELPGVDGGPSLLASLKQVGIDFQDASNFVGSAQLTIDSTALQSAFNANPARTSALLAQAFQTIGVLAVQLAGQNGDFFASGAEVAPSASPFDVLPVTIPAAGGDAAAQGALAGQVPVAANSAPAPTPTPSPALPASAPAVSPLQAPLAAVDNAAVQASLVDQAAVAANDLAENPAQSPVALNAQTAASSALPGNPFNTIANVIPNVTANVTPVASPAGSLNAVDAALQRSLADQALRNALDANPVPVPVPVPAPAAVALTVDKLAQADAPPLVAALGPVAGAPGGANQVANPIASVATVGAGSAASGVQAQAQAQAPLAALDDGRAPLALDPSVAAAVAAYRLGDGALILSANKPAATSSEPNADISAVSRVSSVVLDPQDGSSNARRNEVARSAALALEENKALSATRLPSQITVDVTV